MCVAVPYLVLDVAEGMAALSSPSGATTSASLLAASEPVVAGDWVLVHSGFVLARLTAADVREMDEGALR